MDETRMTKPMIPGWVPAHCDDNHISQYNSDPNCTFRIQFTLFEYNSHFFWIRFMLFEYDSCPKCDFEGFLNQTPNPWLVLQYDWVWFSYDSENPLNHRRFPWFVFVADSGCLRAITIISDISCAVLAKCLMRRCLMSRCGRTTSTSKMTSASEVLFLNWRDSDDNLSRLLTKSFQYNEKFLSDQVSP